MRVLGHSELRGLPPAAAGVLEESAEAGFESAERKWRLELLLLPLWGGAGREGRNRNPVLSPLALPANLL